MGIPSFFRKILRTDKNVISGINEYSHLSADFFFIDFNSIIYNEWARIKNQELSFPIKKKQLVQNVIHRIIYWTTSIIRPKEYVYIAMDGCAPRAKMVQQRSRRYKSILLRQFTDSLYPSNKRIDDIDSSHISPGTPFMCHLKKELEKAMASDKFGNHTVLFSDSNCPGEGEHKFLNRIRKLKTEKKDAKIVVYSPDNDMISLCLLTQKTNIHLLRFIDPFSDDEKHLKNSGYEMLLCDLDKLRTAFSNQMTETYKNEMIDTDRLLLDYNFLLSLVGNDFVPSLPFMKIRSGGLDLLINIYNELRPVYKSYLIEYPSLSIHFEFFKNLFIKLSCIETHEMKKQYFQMEKEYSGQSSSKRLAIEKTMSPEEIRLSRFLHLSFFNPEHPEFSTYGHLFRKINYNQPKHIWKGNYYQYFCGFNPDHYASYNQDRTSMVHNYLESILFTLFYYNKGCPSWDWYYHYRVAPLPSDVVSVLNKDGRLPPLHENNTPYSPFEQLALILPPSMICSILPPSYTDIIKDPRFSFYFVRDIDIDALAGGKFIYSEAILPELDKKTESLLLDAVREKKLSLEEEERNRISQKIKKYIPRHIKH